MKFTIRILNVILIINLISILFNFVTISNGASIGETMNAASGFIADGENPVDENGDKVTTVNTTELNDTSKFIYNLLLALGMIIAVAIGSVLGIKFMLSSVEEKAQIKELLVPYVAGCIVVFGAFGIWRLAVNIFKEF